MNIQGWLARSWRGPIRVLDDVFRGRGRASFCLEMNEKGGLLVRGGAPFVYYIMFFGGEAGLHSVWR